MKIIRRNFLSIIILILAITISYVILIEPYWLRIKTINLTNTKTRITIVHISDLHYKGDKKYLTRVIEKINKIEPDFVCFTGDLINSHPNEALDLLLKIKSPVYGVPGNHDYWGNVPSEAMKKAFKSTGGDWLINEARKIPDKGIEIIGIDGFSDFLNKNKEVEGKGIKRILLVHYPKFVDKIENRKFFLILAGHSHGGQIRFPFDVLIVSPGSGIGKYDKGLFQTKSGPLYVNPGIGTTFWPIRFNCRPEITIFSSKCKKQNFK